MIEKPIWLNDEPVQKLLEIADGAGIELRFVGGCVRDFVMGREVGDIDIATNTLPQKIIEVYQYAGIRVLPTGISHGTVTVMIGGSSFEITTLRRDVHCDGRHASVEFIEEWEVDAQRRDFTMNALFMQPNGEIIDYVGGVADAQAGRVRFIGNNVERITEDYLRILRYYRFLATHGSKSSNIDVNIINGHIKEYAHKLADVSVERIATEMQKLLSAESPDFSLQLMVEAGVWQIISDDAPYDMDSLAKLLKREQEQKIAAQPWRRLVAFMRSPSSSTYNIAIKLRLSKHIKQYLAYQSNPHNVATDFDVRLLREDGLELAHDAILLHAEDDNYQILLNYLHNYHLKAMPINGDILLQHSFKGADIRFALAACKTAWLQSDCILTAEELLAIAKL